MRSFFSSKCLLLIVTFCLSASFVSAQSSDPAIATLLQVEGTVEAVTAKSPKGRSGSNGMLLFAGDKISTSGKSKATIEYRDGSRVRLFQNSEIVLNLSEEQSTSKRTFKFQLSLNNGSMRGRFLKGLQRTKIRTPTALIGIKGTSVRITESKNKATVSLTEGQVEVSNLSSKTLLNPGQWLPEIRRTDDLTKKVASLPNILHLKTAEYQLDFRDGNAKQLKFSVQLQHSISSKSVERSGLVVFESDYYSIRLPKRFLLDKKGFARVMVGIDPPRVSDAGFKGLITIRAFMDQEGFDDVAEGSLVLKIVNSGKKRTLLLDAEEGVIEKKD
jgi:hypothetical protein